MLNIYIFNSIVRGIYMGLLQLTKDNFDKTIKDATTPVFVDFWAPWCGPCKMLGPIFEEASQALDGKVECAKVCVDDESELAKKYSVMSIPTIVIFKGGKEVGRSVGFVDLDQILELAKKHGV